MATLYSLSQKPNRKNTKEDSDVYNHNHCEANKRGVQVQG